MISAIKPAQPNELSDPGNHPTGSDCGWPHEAYLHCPRAQNAVAKQMKMATASLSSSPSKVTTAELGGISRSSSPYAQLTFCSRHPFQKATTSTAFHKAQPKLLLHSPARNKHARTCPATDNDQAAPPPAAQETTTTPDKTPVTSGNNAQPQQPSANGSPPQAPSEPPNRTPLTARERLRAARVLGKYAEPGGGPPSGKGSSPKKPEFGRRVLDALRETDGGGKRADRKRSGLPEAPSNMFDDSRRGLPKGGWTFEALPFGTDVLVIVASFALITILMFGTTYLVWKLGAIHFNEY